MTGRRWIVPLAAGLVLAACASTGPPTTKPALVLEQVALAVQRAQTVEIDLHGTGAISAADHADWQRRYLLMAHALQAMTVALRAEQSPVAAVQQALTVLDQMVTDLLPRVTQETARLWLRTALDVVRALLVTTVAESHPWIPQTCFA